MKTLGARIRFAREKAGLTQAALGKAFGITRNSVSLWEGGINAPTSDKIGIIAKKTGFSAEWLLKGGPLDPGSLKPIVGADDELSDLVAGLRGKKRQKVYEFLLLYLKHEEENQEGQARKPT